MNEIDFSLERVDFALRRRFMWFNYDFDVNTLIDIIFNKTSGARICEINEYAKDAKELNKEISNPEHLGKQYQIGHTFFAEIVDIIKEDKKIEAEDFIKNSKYRKRLWKYSLKPMIEAMLGLNYGDHNSIDEFEKIFSGKKEDDSENDS
jgi:5-methylcytosine-specific restriction protein B